MLAMQTEKQVFVKDAAEKTGIHPDIIKHLISQGVISGFVAGDISTCNLSEVFEVSKLLIKSRIGLEGVGIMAPVAAQKYGFTASSIYKWYKDGWVKLVSSGTGKRSRLFDEADISFAAALAKIVGHLPGRSVFPAKPRSGRPKKS